VRWQDRTITFDLGGLGEWEITWEMPALASKLAVMEIERVFARGKNIGENGR